MSKLNAHSDKAAGVLDLLGRLSLRLWLLSGDASRAGNEASAKLLHDLSDECDAASVMLTPFVLNVSGSWPDIPLPVVHHDRADIDEGTVSLIAACPPFEVTKGADRRKRLVGGSSTTDRSSARGL